MKTNYKGVSSAVFTTVNLHRNMLKTFMSWDKKLKQLTEYFKGKDLPGQLIKCHERE